MVHHNYIFDIVIWFPERAFLRILSEFIVPARRKCPLTVHPLKLPIMVIVANKSALKKTIEQA